VEILSKESDTTGFSRVEFQFCANGWDVFIVKTPPTLVVWSFNFVLKPGSFNCEDTTDFSRVEFQVRPFLRRFSREAEVETPRD
jgi:hypothetical protein